jgi:NAD(P)-dependent dehydrogenase (short-subunit alcohol dehydrogenase family)
VYLEKYDLKGRRAAVSGGGRGSGLACAHALAEGEAALARAGHCAEAIRLDVTDPDAVRAGDGDCCW